MEESEFFEDHNTLEVLNGVMTEYEAAKGAETRETVDIRVYSFVDLAFNQMHSSHLTPKPTCKECAGKDEILVRQAKMIDEKEVQIIEKTNCSGRTDA